MKYKKYIKMFFILLVICVIISCSCNKTPEVTEYPTYIQVPENTIAIIIPKEALTGSDPQKVQENPEQFLQKMERLYPPEKFK
jgi:hypothetical protein